jgi:hypothetical protein
MPPVHVDQPALPITAGRNRWHLAEAASFDDGRPVEHYPFAMDGLKGLLSEGGASGKESEDDKRLAALRYRVARQRFPRSRAKTR